MDTTIYAAHLRSALRTAYLAEPERYGSCKTWTDLHDVCDANDYLNNADELFGIDFPDIDDEKAWESYLAFVNEAIARVEADWPIRRHEARWFDHWEDGASREHRGYQDDAEAERRANEQQGY